jgi:ERF superfamily
MHLQKVSAALVKAQKAFGPALKTSSNPHFKSKYADLSACVEAVIDALNENGIALIQRNIEVPSGVCIETVFVHESGEMLSSGPLHVPAAKQDPQGFGSALTYARRYSLMAACGIAPEDDDGNAGVKATQAQRKPAQKVDSRDDPAEIAKAVKAGKAADVAAYLAGLTQQKMDTIWPNIPPEIQDEITAAWPG